MNMDLPVMEILMKEAEVEASPGGGLKAGERAGVAAATAVIVGGGGIITITERTTFGVPTTE